MYHNIDIKLKNWVSSQNKVYFYHDYGILYKDFLKNKILTSIFEVTSTTIDDKGREYVSAY